MNVMEEAKTLSAAEITRRAAESNLLEFGTTGEKIAEKWKTANAERAERNSPGRMICGLYNGDHVGVLLAILKENPEKIFAGMALAAKAAEAGEMYLYVPEWEADYAAAIEQDAAKFNIKVKTGLIDCRENRDAVFHHILTMAFLSDLMAGCYEPCTYIAICREGHTGELKKVHYGTKIAELTGNEEIRALAVGTKLYDASALQQTIEADTVILNGVITLYGSKCCLIREAEKELLADRYHSCGRCVFCREGLIQLHTMMREITLGQGKKEYPDMMAEIGEAMAFSTLCSMGQTAADFTLGTLKYFQSEYDDHIKKKKCANGVCRAFVSMYIDPILCNGCEKCADICPSDAIEGKAGYIHMLDGFACSKCGRCIEACDAGAVIQTADRVPRLPDKLTKCGRFKKKH
ncbi:MULTISPECIES: NADH-ubiquinone oxidoreductase-F iron-sulfur binding region domain-containing protein [Hungatella]|uniref:Iron reductase subunit beta n=1 Tax=Hungatella hathewayi TaxID=154046 RepID=A0AAW9WAQ4_9FIRM|nr:MULTISPECIES: NADH-ubiquinone oxidoreductase-F iron-sulfur binding region domain-containing protein [Hungatella]MCQ4831511.1 4Fe-4S binding protein [Hungatella sp. SL.1.14]MUB62256.1 iron reductase subunit beta [Hungatella hathewayi]CUP22783.1 NADH:ubiquinone oxidoreductase%2C NADH-binding 51 kDa subunit [Hungatella hathewayi]